MSNILREFISALDKRGINHRRGTCGSVIFNRHDGTEFRVNSSIDKEHLLILQSKGSVDEALEEIFGEENE